MEKRLTRDPQDKMIAGVAAGIAHYFELDVTWVRVAFALAVFFGFSGGLIYIILWIVVPEQSTPSYTYTDYRTEPEMPFQPTHQRKNSGTSLFFGFLLIVLGGYFLLQEFDLLPYWFSLRKLWPLALVMFGLLILSKTKKTKQPIKKPDEPSPDDSEFTNKTDETINL
ncbi:MAG TPA: PspC domain-containing protein [Pelobium sp.]